MTRPPHRKFLPVLALASVLCGCADAGEEPAGTEPQADEIEESEWEVTTDTQRIPGAEQE